MAKKGKRRAGASPSDRMVRPAAAPVACPQRSQCLLCRHEFEDDAELGEHVRSTGHRHFRVLPAVDPGAVTDRD